ncbi:hypothetical protein BDCR2A_00477 [Borrelia duttonii CR2A]|uniref:DUF3996 domain-containing protein n=1 Tax=Borrelia duttonii CR2A TaxID=1432657 RepID=W6TM79_9SPIR|nr:DUF3996 domain-containing protein [Borrelia duttonii]ETZ18504.1 hypothetical protein BDCR2A_00477 [Borrelia duttonii CR2A]
MKTQLTILMIFLTISSSIATTINPEALNRVLNKQHSQKSSYPSNIFGIGFGIGNPITNIIINFPYVDVDFGYGGFNGLHPNNFIPYIVLGTDIVFKEEVYHNTTLSGGLGIGIDLSQVKPNEQDASNVTQQNNNGQNKQEEFSLTSSNNRLGFTIRLPIILEYGFLKNVFIGFKAITTIGATMIFNPTSMEGIRFGFFGFGFIKIYI